MHRNTDPIKLYNDEAKQLNIMHGVCQLLQCSEYIVISTQLTAANT